MLSRIRLIYRIYRLPLKVVPLGELADITKKLTWFPVGKYPDFVLRHMLHYLELGNDGEFRYAYEPT